MFAFILLGLSQNLRECPSLNITIFIGHFSRQAEVGAKIERAAMSPQNGITPAKLGSGRSKKPRLY
jgi:hypothetical protein